MKFSASFGAVEFSQAAQRTLKRHAQLDHPATEAGGILLGRLIIGTNDVVVDVATPPTAKDRRSRFAFTRDRKQSQAEVDDAWRWSAGTTIYLGEWHTHPEDDPSPSTRDIADRRQILKKTKCEQNDLLFVIVGRRFVRLWEGNRSSGIVTHVARHPLNQLEDNET